MDWKVNVLRNTSDVHQAPIYAATNGQSTCAEWISALARL
jgi:hypothetical protein